MKVHFLNCGTMKPLLAKQFIPDLAEVISLCMLVESDDGLVLIDTGFGTKDLEDPRRLGTMNRVLKSSRDTEAAAVRQIASKGLDPSDVRSIVCTHLDRDHAGGLSDFPDASVHVLEAERDAALHPANMRERERYRECHFTHGPKWAAHSPTASDKWFGLDCVSDPEGLPDGIVLVPLGGHTRGHCGVAVDTDAGWVLHCGDAYYVPDELEGTSMTPMGVRVFRHLAHMDSEAALAQLDKLNAASRESGGSIDMVCSHYSGGLSRV